jgi:hypothetical protein
LQFRGAESRHYRGIAARAVIYWRPDTRAYGRENISNVAPLIVLEIIVAALVGRIMDVAQRDRGVGEDSRQVNAKLFFATLDRTASDWLGESIGCRGIFCPRTRFRELAESVPPHLASGEPFGKGS